MLLWNIERATKRMNCLFLGMSSGWGIGGIQLAEILLSW